MSDSETATDAAPAAAPAAAAKNFSVDFLSITKEAQMHNGLRHGDYERYRGYCSRRLARVRRSVGLTHRKGETRKHHYEARPLSAEMVTDAAVLLIPLFNAERAWAFAMHLKPDAEQPRSRQHMVSRLRKATEWAEKLKSLCDETADARTCLEAEAYANWMQANWLLEREQWSESLDFYVKARTVYDRLGAVGDTIQQELCRQRVEEMDPNIRFCNYNLGSKEDAEKLVAMRFSQDPGMELLRSKLDAVVSATRKERSEALTELEWRGLTLQIRSDRVREALVNETELETAMAKTELAEERSAILDKLQTTYDEAARTVRADLKALQESAKSQKAELQADNLGLLTSFFESRKIEVSIRRTKAVLASLPAERDEKGRIRLYENVIQATQDLLEMPGGDDPTVKPALEAQLFGAKAQRCYYMAQLYAQAGKFTEAFVLYERAGEHAGTALRQAQRAGAKADEAEIRRLQDAVRAKRCEWHARAALKALETDDTTAHDTTALAPLAKRLDQFILSDRIADLPPDMESIPGKPLFFDIAADYFGFVDVSHRIDQKKEGGGFFGLFRR